MILRGSTEFGKREKGFSSAYGKEIERNIADIHKYDGWTQYGGGRFGLFEFVKDDGDA